MDMSRRELLETGAYAGAVLAAAGIAGASRAQEAAQDFDIDAAFATFMRDTGQEPGDGGGAVTFTGSDPILRSHFRIGTSMALPAMAAAVGAAAIWRDRTGEGQDVAIDLREAVYNVNPMHDPGHADRLANGAVAPTTLWRSASPSPRRSTATSIRRRSGSAIRSPSCHSAPRTGAT